MTQQRGRPRIPDDVLLDELRRVADELGEPPTAVQMSKYGEYSVRTYRNHFGRWSKALKEAGLDVDRRR